MTLLGIAAERAEPAKAKRVTAAARKRMVWLVVCKGMTRTEVAD